MMLDFLGHGRGAGRAAYDAIVTAIEHVLAQGPHTSDLGGTASTTDMGKAIAAHVSGSRS
jgi:tartrate dehydrogenase/decarboxylase/D-malate dehydrogenase